jgi:hypothetical protein
MLTLMMAAALAGLAVASLAFAGLRVALGTGLSAGLVAAAVAVGPSNTPAHAGDGKRKKAAEDGFLECCHGVGSPFGFKCMRINAGSNPKYARGRSL